MDQITKVPSVLNTPPILVKNNMRPLGLVSFQVLGDDDKTVITVNVPRDRNTIDLTHYAPFHNLVMSSTLKRLIDEDKILLLNKAEIDEWIKEKCPESGGECPINPGPELKDQTPLTFDSTPIDSKVVKGRGEKGAVVSLPVGTNIYYALVKGDGTFEIQVESLTVGSFVATSIKSGYKDAKGTLTTTALTPSADLVIAPFVAMGEMTGTAQPNAIVTARTPFGIEETTADSTDGSFTIYTSLLYDKDENYIVDVVAALAGFEPKSQSVTGLKADIPNVTLKSDPVFGDTTLAGNTKPFTDVSVYGSVTTSNRNGEFYLGGLVPFKGDVLVQFGTQADSVYKNDFVRFEPKKRQLFMTGQNPVETDTSIKLRAYGVVDGLDDVKVRATIGTETVDAQADAAGNITITPVVLTGITQVVITTDSQYYEAQTLTLDVLKETAELLDQEQLTVTEVYEDAKAIKGTGEPDAIVALTVNGNAYYTHIDSSGNYSITVSDLVSGQFSMISIKTGYKNSTASLTIKPLHDSDELVVNPFVIRQEINGTATPNSKIEVESGAGLTTTTADENGVWEVNTLSLFPDDQTHDVHVRSLLATYKTVEKVVTGSKITAPAMTIASPVVYGDRSISIETEPNARVKSGTTVRIASYDGQVTFTFADPIAAPVKVSIGIDANSIYNAKEETFTPQAREVFLQPVSAKQSDTDYSVRVLGTVSGLTKPTLIAFVDGDETTPHEAQQDDSSFAVFHGLDLTAATQIHVQVKEDLYRSTKLIDKVLTNEEAGDLKDQEPLVATAIFSDEMEINGTGEPLAILSLTAQGNTFYTRVGADGNWRIDLAGDFTQAGQYTIQSSKAGYKDATGDLTVKPLKTPVPISINDFIIGEDITGTGEPGANIVFTVDGYVDTADFSSSVKPDGTFSAPSMMLYKKDLRGAVKVQQYADHSTTSQATKEPTSGIVNQNLTTDRPVTYGDQYFVVQTIKGARITYDSQTKVADEDGQVLFRPDALTSEIRVGIGTQPNSIYEPYVATITPNRVDAFFSTQTILTSMTAITFQVFGLRAGMMNPEVILKVGTEEHKANINANSVKFEELDLQGVSEVKVSVNATQYSNTEYTFLVTDVTIPPAELDQADLMQTQ